MLIIELSSEKHALQNIQNDCYEGLSDSCRVHQIRFRPGLRPGPHWGSSRRSPRPPSRLGRGTPPPHSPPSSTPSASRSRRLRRLVLGAFGASFPKPPPKFFSGYGPVCRQSAVFFKNIFLSQSVCPMPVMSSTSSHFLTF